MMTREARSAARMKVPAERRRQIAELAGRARASALTAAQRMDISRIGGMRSQAVRSAEERAELARRAGRLGNLKRWGRRNGLAAFPEPMPCWVWPVLGRPH